MEDVLIKGIDCVMAFGGVAVHYAHGAQYGSGLEGSHGIEWTNFLEMHRSYALENVSFVDEEGDGVGWRGEGDQKGNGREERRRGEERRIEKSRQAKLKFWNYERPLVSLIEIAVLMTFHPPTHLFDGSDTSPLPIARHPSPCMATAASNPTAIHSSRRL